MDNQHRKIKGYRELSQGEINLMNEIKAKGEELGELLVSMEHGFNLAEEFSPLSIAQDKARRDCIANAEKDLKQGIMWAVRSVALPDSF